jgi:hypothetical protein
MDIKDEELQDTAFREAIRYLVLTNGGGAVAASTFLGGTISSGHTMTLGALPLIFWLL